ncbi:MAG: thioesterase family protein [Planctomycetota bacterium]
MTKDITGDVDQDYWPISIPITVAWGDMDALGHVNNTRFLRWFEDARMEAFRQIGTLELTPAAISGPILARVECVFRSPVRFPDMVTSEIRATDPGADRYTLEHRIVSQQQQRVVALGTSRIVEVNYKTGEKVPLTPEILAALKEICP